MEKLSSQMPPRPYSTYVSRMQHACHQYALGRGDIYSCENPPMKRKSKAKRCANSGGSSTLDIIAHDHDRKRLKK
jgi:hypothetical protein